MKTLHILQNKNHAEHFFKFFRNSNEDIPLALTIDAIYILEKKKIKFLSINDFYTKIEQELDKKIYHSRLVNLMKSLNKLFENNFSDSLYLNDSFGFQYSVIFISLNFCNFLSKKILNSQYKRIVCYENFVLAKTIYKYRPNPNLLIYLFLNHNNKDSIIKKKKFLIPLENLLEEFKSICKDNLWPFFRIWFKLIRNKKNKNKKGRIHKNFLLVGGEYDWLKYTSNIDNVKVSRFKRKINYFFIFKNFLEKKNLYKNICLKISSEFIFPIKLVKSTLNPFINFTLKDIYFIKHNKKYIQEIVSKNEALLTCCIIDPIETYIAYKFKEHEKPIYLWQHGERGQMAKDHKCNLFEYSEMRICTHYLAYSKKVKEYVERYMNLHMEGIKKPKFFNVGSLDKKIDKRIIRNPKYIILASGKIKGIGGNHFEGDPDLRLFNIHKAFLTIAKYYSNKYDFLFKKNNTLMFSRLPYKCDNVIFDDKTPFKSLIPQAKAIILDTPGTTLLEATQTNVPIFGVLGRSDYNNDFLDLSRKRICWCKDSEDLKLKLMDFLDKELYDSDVNYDFFNKSYLGHYSNKIITNKVKEIMS